MNDLLKACFEATGADPAMAERAALAAMEPDIIGLLIDHQAAAMVRLGRSMEQARVEAIDAVAVFMKDAGRMAMHDITIGAAIRQDLVYRLCCQGITKPLIAERLSICLTQVKKDYRAAKARRHGAGIAA